MPDSAWWMLWQGRRPLPGVVCVERGHHRVRWSDLGVGRRCCARRLPAEVHQNLRGRPGLPACVTPTLVTAAREVRCECKPPQRWQ